MTTQQPTAQPTRVPPPITATPAAVVEPFATPELFPGFQELFASEEERERQIEFQIQQLAEEDKQLTSRQVDEVTIRAEQDVLLGAEGGLALSRQFAPGLVGVDRESAKARRQEINRELSNLATSAERARWRMGIISLIQRDIQEEDRRFTTVKELANIVSIPLTQEDREFAQLILDGLGQSDVEEVTLSQGDQKALQRLQQPGTNLARLFAKNPAGKTAAELVDIVAAAHRFQLPEGMSIEDQRDLLRAHDASDEDIARFTAENKAEMDLIIQTIRDDTVRLEAFKKDLADFSSGEINSQIRKSLQLQVMTRPGLILMKPFEWWAKYVGKPFAAAVLLGIDQANIVGSPIPSVINDSFYRGFSEARTKGSNTWMAFSYAFEEWDTNGVLKFGTEVILDPINVLGFTWVTKIVKPLPLIGKPLAAFNQGYMKVAEYPFDILKEIGTSIPKPLSTRALRASITGYDDTRVLLYQVYRKPLSETSPDEVRLALRPTIELAQNNPTSPDPMVTVGQWLLPNRIITAADVQQLSIKLGKEININPEVLERANAVMEITDGFGIAKFSLPDQSADRLLHVFDVLTTTDRFNAMKTWLMGIQSDMRRIAERRIQGTSTKQILSNVMDGIADDYRTASISVIANQRYQQGLIAAGLDGLSWAQRTLITGGLERFITMPFARAYLLFGYYGAGNLLETTLIKTGLGAGLNPFWRDNPHVDAGILFANLRGAPDTIFESGDFILNLGDEGALRRLSDFASSGRGNANTVLTDTRPITEKVLAPRFIKSLTGFNWFNRAGNAALANYWNRFFIRLVGERHPQVLKATDDLVGHLTIGLDDLTTPNTARRIRKLLRKRLITGDIQLAKNGVRDTINLNAIKAGELEPILNRHQEIAPDVKDFLRQRALNGDLWTLGTVGIEKYFKDVMEPMLLSRYFDSPQFFQDNLATLADDLDAFIPTTVEELNTKTAMLGEMVDMYGDVVNVSLESAGLYSRKILNPAIRDDFWNAWWETKIDPILNPIADRIEESARILREQLADSPIRTQLEAEGKLSHYLSFMDSMSKSNASIKEARLAQSRIRAEYFQSLGSKYKAPNRRDAQFWENFNSEIDEMWTLVNDSRFKFMEQAIDAAMRSEFIQLPTPVDVSSITMKPEHLAKLFGISSQEMLKQIYMPELMALRGKQSFTSRMMAQAERTAARGNTTAEALGYTKARVAAVYDEIMKPIRATIETEGHSFANSQLELKNLMDEMIKLAQRQNAIASDDLVEFMQRQVYGGMTEEITRTTTRRRSIEELTEAGELGIVKTDTGRELTVSEARLRIRAMEGTISSVGPGFEVRLERDIRRTLTSFKERTDDTISINERDRLEEGLNVNIPENREEAIRTIEQELEQQIGRVDRVRERINQLQIDIDKGTADAIERGIVSIGADEITTVVIPPRRVDSELDRIVDGAVPPTVNQDGLNQLLNPEWNNTLQDDIVPEIQRNFSQDFPDYNNANVVAATMKTFIPFWHYEAHRFFWWLPREALRHPGVIATMGKYRNNTDEGYINVPGTPLDVNATRGSIFMGGMRRLFQRDYPEYYDEFEGTAEVLDYMSRWGFYPGAPLAIPLAIFGAKRNMQIGALVPQWQKSIMDVATVAFPDSPAIQRLRDTLFNDGFRDYVTGLAASSQGNSGPDLQRKRVKGESFTEDEQRQWNSATRKIAIWSPIMEQSGLFRFNPNERRVFRRQTAEAAAEIMGTDPDAMAAVFEDLRKQGLLFEDVFGALPPEVNDIMRTLEGFHQWTGHGISLGPSELGEQRAIIQEFFSKVTNHSERQQNILLQVEADMRAGVRDMNDWLRANKENRKSTRDFIEILQTEDKYKDIPMGMQERIDWAVEHNTPVPIFSGMEELQQFYYKIELREAFNFDTGTIEFDWDTFYNEQDAVRLGMPNDIEERFDARIARNDTPLQRKHRELNRDLFRIYFNTTFDIVLANNTPEQQSQIRRFKASANPLERQELRQVVDGESRLISTFNSELRNTRQNIRDVDPELDAWLVFFNPRMTPRTQASTDRFLSIKREFGVP